MQDDGGRRLPNMRDVARAANLSLITVSRAMREPEKVRPETRERVEQAIAEIDYVPHLAARSLQKSRSNIVALLLPSLQNSAFSTTAQGLLDVLEPEGYQLMVGSIGDFRDPSVERKLLSAFLGRRPDAIVLTGARRDEATDRMLERSSIPVINIWSKSRHPSSMSIGPDNRRAAREMTEGLLDRGYARIGFLGGYSKYNDIVRARRLGYRDAMSKCGIAPSDSWLKEIDAPARMIEVGDAFMELLATAPEIDAVFCPGDHYAIGALLRANAEGIAVPGRVAIAGFGDHELAARMTPALTTVHVDAYELGRVAGGKVLSALFGEASHKGKVITVGHELVWRAST